MADLFDPTESLETFLDKIEAASRVPLTDEQEEGWRDWWHNQKAELAAEQHTVYSVPFEHENCSYRVNRHYYDEYNGRVKLNDQISIDGHYEQLQTRNITAIWEKETSHD